MRITDAEIIERLRKGEGRAYGLIIDRYRDRGFSLALRILKNREDAEEALQDAFVRAYRGLVKFEGASSFGTWFYRILYNACMTSLSQRKRADRMVVAGEPEEITEPADSEDPRDLRELEVSDLMARVGEVMGGLPEKYSSIISMFYLQELSYAEIAEVTGMPVGTVKTHLFRARGLLQREVLKKTEGRVAV